MINNWDIISRIDSRTKSLLYSLVIDGTEHDARLIAKKLAGYAQAPTPAIAPFVYQFELPSDMDEGTLEKIRTAVVEGIAQTNKVNQFVPGGVLGEPLFNQDVTKEDKDFPTFLTLDPSESFFRDPSKEPDGSKEPLRPSINLDVTKDLNLQQNTVEMPAPEELQASAQPAAAPEAAKDPLQDSLLRKDAPDPQSLESFHQAPEPKPRPENQVPPVRAAQPSGQPAPQMDAVDLLNTQTETETGNPINDKDMLIKDMEGTLLDQMPLDDILGAKTKYDMFLDVNNPAATKQATQLRDQKLDNLADGKDSLEATFNVFEQKIKDEADFMELEQPDPVTGQYRPRSKKISLTQISSVGLNDQTPQEANPNQTPEETARAEESLRLRARSAEDVQQTIQMPDAFSTRRNTAEKPETEEETLELYGRTDTAAQQAISGNNMVERASLSTPPAESLQDSAPQGQSMTLPEELEIANTIPPLPGVSVRHFDAKEHSRPEQPGQEETCLPEITIRERIDSLDKTFNLETTMNTEVLRKTFQQTLSAFPSGEKPGSQEGEDFPPVAQQHTPVQGHAPAEPAVSGSQSPEAYSASREKLEKPQPQRPDPQKPSVPQQPRMGSTRTPQPEQARASMPAQSREESPRERAKATPAPEQESPRTPPQAAPASSVQGRPQTGTADIPVSPKRTFRIRLKQPLEQQPAAQNNTDLQNDNKAEKIMQENNEEKTTFRIRRKIPAVQQPAAPVPPQAAAPQPTPVPPAAGQPQQLAAHAPAAAPAQPSTQPPAQPVQQAVPEENAKPSMSLGPNSSGAHIEKTKTIDHSIELPLSELKKHNWPLEVPLVPTYTLENLVISVNRFAHATTISVIDAPGKLYNPLVLYGSTGTGKTHFLNAIGYALSQKIGQENIFMTNGVRLSRGIQRYVMEGNIEKFEKFMDSVQVLLIDDIHLVAVNEQNRVHISNLLNKFLRQQKQIVITSKYPPESLAKLEELIQFKLDSGWISELKTAQGSAHLKIVKKMLNDNGVDLTDIQVESFFGAPNMTLSTVARSIRRIKVLESVIFPDLQDVDRSQAMILEKLLATRGEDQTSMVWKRDIDEITSLPPFGKGEWGRIGFFYPQNNSKMMNWMVYALSERAKELGIEGSFEIAVRSSYATENIISSAFKIANLCDNKKLKGAVILGPSLQVCDPSVRENFYDILTHMLEVMLIRCGVINMEDVKLPSTYVKLISELLR